jgi:hypothetical protein
MAKRMDGKALGRLAVDVRGLREAKKYHEGQLTKINAELAKKEPILVEQMQESQLMAIAGA